MEKYFYSCDGGSLAVLCGNSIIRIPNGYGDGTFKVYHFESTKEFEDYIKEHKELYGLDEKTYKYITFCDFSEAKVLTYDYLKLAFVGLEETLFVLNGAYAVYRNSGKIYFVKQTD